METRSVGPEFTSGESRSLVQLPLLLARQEQTYCKHFGFAEPPFSVISDPQFFYRNAANQKILTALSREIAARSTFVAVTGEPGIGKTTLLRRLIGDSADRIDYIFIGVQARGSFVEVLRDILGKTGVSSASTDQAALLAQLDDYLQERRAKHRGVALVFDEAQTISDEVLKELSLLCSGEGKGLMSIVLVGQPGLQGRLAQLIKSLKQRMTLTKRLTPLRRDEVAPYIALRLNQVGYQGEELFEQQAIERIVKASGGVPRLINAVCDGALLRAYRACERRVTAKMIDQVVHELRLSGNLPSRDHRISVERIRPGNFERAFLSPPVNTDKWVVDFEKAKEGSRPREPAHELEKLGQRRDPFVSHLRLLIGALMILVAAAWSFVMFYPQRRNVTESAVAQREKSSSRTAETDYSPAEPRRFENKAVEKKPSQPAPASIPNLAVAENERRNELADTKRPDDSPSVSKAESPASEEIYRVSGASFVRNKPTANAEIIDTLQPGVRIAIIDRSGEYYRVSSLGERTVFGFVHKEDAFFERVQ